LWLFPKANKSQGIAQLEKVSYQAFYTRTEARYFLLQIYGIENMNEKAYEIAKYTSETFPDNPYFHRYYARSAFMNGNIDEASSLSKEILRRIDQHQVGYEGTSGRYASYILGYYALYAYRNQAEATKYFKQCMEFTKATDATDSGYYWASVLGLARISFQQQNYDQAVDYCKEVLDHAEKKSAQHTEAKKLLSEAKKARRKKR
jgi:cytochrome c-type biogenesis protein CcmH/NrfG